RNALNIGLALGLGSGVLAACSPKQQPAAKVAVKKIRKPGPPLHEWPTLDAMAMSMVRRKLTPGLALSVSHDGTLLYSKGFGTASFASGAPVTAQSAFRIGSITKQFTAAAILLLAEAGQLSVDDTLARFLPAFPRASDITLRQMLSHTSGLSDYLNGQSQEVLEQAQTRDYSAADLIHIIEARKPLYRVPPGTAWLYSNSGFTLLSIVVEHIANMPFGQFCQQHLFGPAGMEDSAIDPAGLVVPNHCDGYRPDFRAPNQFDPIKPISPSFGLGAGGIRSTTEDLCAWHAALLDGRIIKPQSLKVMFTPERLKNGELAFEHNGPEKLEYGFGLGMGKMGDRLYIAHGGRVNGFTGHLRSYPGDKLTIAIQYNSDGGGAGDFMPSQRRLRYEATRLGYEAIGITVDPSEAAPPDGSSPSAYTKGRPGHSRSSSSRHHHRIA
ncbi:MAG: serine hydrolase domain-containing protein, partial [Asticcacaulis sp.]